MRKKRTHFGGPHFLRMALVVEKDESPNPAPVGFLGAKRILSQSRDFAHPVNQPDLRRIRQRTGEA